MTPEDFHYLQKRKWIFKPQDGLWYHRGEPWAGYKGDAALVLARQEERAKLDKNGGEIK